MNIIKNICVNCGSSPGNQPDYEAMAVLLGRTLAENNIRLIYGGSDLGLMGAVAKAALQNKGEVVGVIPEDLSKKVTHPPLSELYIVDSMHQRKAKMFELADGFIALPGGLGTLDEMFEILTWAQLGIHGKPFGLLNVAGYYNPLIHFLDQAVQEGFIYPSHTEILLVDHTPAGLLKKIQRY